MQPAPTATGPAAALPAADASELQAAIAAAHAERDDAIAAAQAAHADAERAQLREQMKVRQWCWPDCINPGSKATKCHLDRCWHRRSAM